MPKYTSISIIYNPNSTGSSKEDAKDLKKVLETKYSELPIKLISTEYAGHAEAIAYQAAKSSKRPLIISSSGDGGYNEVINGVMMAKNEGASPICAVLPAGNANDHSRTLSDRPLVDSIFSQKITSIDLLRISFVLDNKKQEKYAHSYIGLGLTPVAAVELNKQTLNAYHELIIVLKTFFRFRPFKIEVGGKVKVLDSILFTNISQMAKVLTISKNAKINDGRFEVVIFPHSNKLALIRKLLKASTVGLEPKKDYKHYEFTVLKKMPIQVDGEVMYLEKNALVSVTCRQQIIDTII